MFLRTSVCLSVQRERERVCVHVCASLNIQHTLANVSIISMYIYVYFSVYISECIYNFYVHLCVFSVYISMHIYLYQSTCPYNIQLTCVGNKQSQEPPYKLYTIHIHAIFVHHCTYLRGGSSSGPPCTRCVRALCPSLPAPKRTHSIVREHIL